MKYLACLFLFVVLLARIAGIMHFALVRHAACADHDELVHLPDTAEQSALRADHVGTGLENVTVPSAHHHDHCLAQLRLRDVVTPGARSAVSLEALAPARAPSLSGTKPPPALSVLRIAPKTSPPIQS